ncbi:hypothetical protein [Mesorhizobium sp. BR1-1-2]|uniref:hypothetical protein n=1 Tax=Mesorhizobium sp. BR1-1-2 TaxID=2876652 RepID=UPI001CCEBB9B|nr:hypothetical protein [Mesorhizobium sp. BR1-1-2]MBZ9966444.1 hypothetical protein [Mesorhizobium sp. BR1-1-2]
MIALIVSLPAQIEKLFVPAASKSRSFLSRRTELREIWGIDGGFGRWKRSSTSTGPAFRATFSSSARKEPGKELTCPE